MSSPQQAPAAVPARAVVTSLEPEAPRRRLLVVVNPYATTVSDRLRRLVVRALAGSYEVEAVGTRERGHATELAQTAAREGYDAVVAFGGDGTVNEVANGLAGTETALTCLPGGSANVYCRILGIPGDVIDATEHLLRIFDAWKPRQVDLASVNGRGFTFSSGLGLDASVVRRVDARPRLKARFGPWFFTSSAVTSLAGEYVIKPPRMIVTAAGETCEGVTAVVQNAAPFTYFRDRPIEIAQGASLTSGTLSGAVLRRVNPFDMPSLTWRAFAHRRKLIDHRGVWSYSGVHEVTVASADGRPLPLQVDGDYLGDVQSATYTVAPGVLLVVS